MAFPVTGLSHGLAAAPGHGQVALGTKKVARPWGGQGMGAPRHFLRPQRQLAMAWRRRQAMETPSNWERPVTGTGNAITSIGNAITLNGNAGVGWGGGEAVSN